MPGKTTLRLRISDMLRFMYENIASIGAGTEGIHLLKEYEMWEKREDRLKGYLKDRDYVAYGELVEIDIAQDKIIADIFNLFVLIIAENQASNKLIEHYDPKAMKEKVKEERKRIESQFLLFQGGESIEQKERNNVGKSSEISSERNNEGYQIPYSKIPGSVFDPARREKSGRGTAIPIRSR